MCPDAAAGYRGGGGGGSKARAFGGMGRGMAEDGGKEGRARGGEKVAAGAAIGGMLVLGKDR